MRKFILILLCLCVLSIPAYAEDNVIVAKGTIDGVEFNAWGIGCTQANPCLYSYKDGCNECFGEAYIDESGEWHTVLGRNICTNMACDTHIENPFVEVR
jgi:hypothetical protein